ncbi:AAA family ATPase [Nocardioides donggukensis]|uniref:AAA family ATPase n=1 Tax=Nocardioides donggukensis TaxID=2774019 RepID=A0A927K7L7_9ACTN|nr:AAA family ATPase [Nocardioides donggukensis]MBD8869155.1 AAA family ATPase [Nocardioides donggukensis]
MPVIVDKDPTVVESLMAVLPPGTHGVEGTDALQAWMTHRDNEFAVVIGPNLDLDEALAVSESMRFTRPSTSVVLVRDEMDTTLLHRAMQSGCRDVVLSTDIDSVVTAVDRAGQLWAALHGDTAGTAQGHVITVFSPKGGVGKTTTAVNLALALADGGSRKVCLIDLDLAFGDVAITMQLFPSHTIEEAIGGEDAIDFPMVESLLTRHEQSLMVLAAPSLPDARDRVSATLVARMMRTLKQEFDYVVVDTCPSFDEQTLQALDETDECVIVATLDVPTLKNVKVALETLDLLNLAPDNRHLVLNRADDAVGLHVDKVSQILGMPITTAIPSSLDIAASTNAGKPIVVSNAGHPASAAFRELAARLADQLGDEHPGVADAAPATSSDGDRKSRRLRKKR